MAQAPHKSEDAHKSDPHKDDPHKDDPHKNDDQPVYKNEQRAADPDTPPNMSRPPYADGRGRQAAWDADHPGPLTTQTDQVLRSQEMEREGPANWMERTNREIAERQGDAPDEPRQVHGVAPAQRPR